MVIQGEFSALEDCSAIGSLSFDLDAFSSGDCRDADEVWPYVSNFL